MVFGSFDQVGSGNEQPGMLSVMTHVHLLLFVVWETLVYMISYIIRIHLMLIQ